MKHISKFLMLALVAVTSSALADCGKCHERAPRAPRTHCSSCHVPRPHCGSCHRRNDGPVDTVTAPVVGTTDAVLGSPWYYDQD